MPDYTPCLKVSTRRVSHHDVDATCQLRPAGLAGSEPRAVFCDRAQESRLVEHAIYDGGEDGTVEVLISQGIKLI